MTMIDNRSSDGDINDEDDRDNWVVMFMNIYKSNKTW